MENAVFWDVSPRRSCVNRCFGGKYRVHLQGSKIRRQGTNVSRWSYAIWRRYVPPKRRFTQDLRGDTSQKKAFFIVTAVKTSYLIRILMFTDFISILCRTLKINTSRGRVRPSIRSVFWNYWMASHEINVLPRKFQVVKLLYMRWTTKVRPSAGDKNTSRLVTRPEAAP
jgi:hypothetical protein